MVKVGSYHAKTHLPRLLKRVARGERITITRHVIEEMKEFRKGRKLGNITVRELIEEGRRF
jgi:putative ubiquitin-RnfH superfamily antitoxin RatB of RatAB toxin-antitoxin module